MEFIQRKVRDIHKLFRHFWEWSSAGKVSFVLFVVVPLIFGYILMVFVSRFVYDRTRPVVYAAVGPVQYTTKDQPFSEGLGTKLDSMYEKIRDSLRVNPYSLNVPLPPFEIRVSNHPQTHETAYLLHCRLWCDCRKDLPEGSFQLLIFQLNPTASSYQLVADTVMSWADYVKPFKLTTAYVRR